MKTHKGLVRNYLNEEREEINSSYLDGSFFGGFTTMSMHNLTPEVEGKDLVFDVVLKELVNHKQALKDGKEVTVHVEWDIKDDYSEYIACRVLNVELADEVGAE